MTKHRISILCLVLFGWLDGSEAQNCSIPAIYVDLHERNVSTSDFPQYGGMVGVGSPMQTLSLWPSLRQNDTSVADSGFCQQSNLTNCASSTGGTFDSSLSKTWKTFNSQTTSTTDSKQTMNNLVRLGIETIHLFTHLFYGEPVTDVEVPDIPIIARTGGTTAPGTFGLGSGSTLLSRLYDLGLVAGRTYSLALGSGFIRAGGSRNGSIVLGGYDAARFKGKIHTYPMDLKNPDYLPVNVTDLILDHPTKGRISIMDDDSFVARITTEQYPMVFPVGSRRKFKSTFGAVKSNNTHSSFLIRDASFNTSLTVVLSDGFNVTIPPTQLRHPETNLTAVASLSPNYTGPFYLSSAWLTQVYVMLDFDAQRFHLAKATRRPKPAAPNIFCPGEIPFSRVDAESNDQDSTSKPSFLAGILGGTFGGIAFLLIGGLIWLHLRKKRQAGDTEDAKLRHEPILFFSDEELRQRSDASRICDSTKSIEMKRLGGRTIPESFETPLSQQQQQQQQHRRRGTETTIAETEPEIHREAEMDLATILKSHGTPAQSPQVLQSPTMVVSRSVSPVSINSMSAIRKKDMGKG